MIAKSAQDTSRPEVTSPAGTMATPPIGSGIGQVTVQPGTEKEEIHSTTIQPIPVKRMARRSGILHSHRLSKANPGEVVQPPSNRNSWQYATVMEAASLKKCEGCGKCIVGAILRCARCTIKRPDLPPPTTITISDDEDTDDFRPPAIVITISDDEDRVEGAEFVTESDRMQPHTSTSPVQQHTPTAPVQQDASTSPVQQDMSAAPIQQDTSTAPVQQDMMNASMKRSVPEDSTFGPRKRAQDKQMSAEESLRRLREEARKNQFQFPPKTDSPEPHGDISNSTEVLGPVDEASLPKSADDARAGSPLRQSRSDGTSQFSMNPTATPHHSHNLRSRKKASAEQPEKRSTLTEVVNFESEAMVPSIVNDTAVESLPDFEKDSLMSTELSVPFWGPKLTDEDVEAASRLSPDSHSSSQPTTEASTMGFSPLTNSTESQVSQLVRPSKIVKLIIKVPEHTSQVSTKSVQAAWTEEDEAQKLKDLRARGVKFDTPESDPDETNDNDIVVNASRRNARRGRPRTSRNLGDLDSSHVMTGKYNRSSRAKTLRPR